MFLQYTKKRSVELTLFRRRGTGIPKEENRQAHAILSYSMNIARLSLFFLKITSFLHRDVQRTLCLYISGTWTAIILIVICKDNDVSQVISSRSWQLSIFLLVKYSSMKEYLYICLNRFEYGRKFQSIKEI